MTLLSITGYLVLGIYILCLSYVTIFCLMQMHLLLKYLKPTSPDVVPSSDNVTEWPIVTVQLPVYNEKYVIERLIDCITQLDYPKSKLEIQILDDSNDETTSLAEGKVKEYSKLEYDIKVIRRPVREGYKAGALQYGLQHCKGEFIAIFSDLVNARK